MKDALIKSGLCCAVTVLAELFGFMIGAFTLDENSTTGPIAGHTYVPMPIWVYGAMPLAIGLVAFLWFLHKEHTGRSQS